MAAGDSDVSICNQALAMLGADRIASLLDPSREALLCSQFYTTVRRGLLRRRPWNFAKAQAQLAASATPPLHTWSTAFPLPADFVRMVDEPEEVSPAYEVMGDQLLANEAGPFNCVYIRDVTDATLFDDLFVGALAAALAAELARPLTQSVTSEQYAAQKVQARLDDAALVNAQENAGQRLEDDVLLRSRW